MAQSLMKLREMGAEELAKEEHSLREEIWKLRLQASTGQLTGPQRVRAAKKELARVLTVAREKEMAARGAKS